MGGWFRKQFDGICMAVPLFLCAQTSVPVFLHAQVHVELHKSVCHNACTKKLIKMVLVSVRELVILARCSVFS